MISETASIATITVFVILTVGFLIATITVSVLLSQKEKENIVLKEEIESGGESGGGGGGETTSSFWVVSGQAAAGNANNIWYSSDGIAWTAGTGDTFGDSTYSGGFDVHYSTTEDKWVTVGRDTQPGFKNISSSDDGIAWTGQKIGPGNADNLVRISKTTYNSKLYHANNRWYLTGRYNGNGGNTSNIWYSDDGISWSSEGITGGLFPATTSFETRACGIFYNGTDRWVVVGATNNGTSEGIWYSDDGLAWTDSGSSAFSSTNGVGLDVHYANGNWVAVGNGGADNQKVWYSLNNAVTWAPATVTAGDFFGNRGASLVYYSIPDDRWVVAGDGSANRNMYYADNANVASGWTVCAGAPFGIDGNVNDLYYNGIDKWVAVGKDLTNDQQIWFSSDGITWFPSTGSDFGSGEGVAVHYANSVWVAVGDEGNPKILTSPDGETWTVSLDITTELSVAQYADVYYGNGVWVASVSNSALNTPSTYFSLDNGTTWTEIIFNISIPMTNINSRNIDHILYADGKWVLFPLQFGTNSGSLFQALISTNGVNFYNSIAQTAFVELNTGQVGNGKKVIYTNNKWIACGNGDTRNLLTSTNASVWNTLPAYIINKLFVISNSLNDIIFANNLWLAGGDNGSFLYSFDGDIWTVLVGGSSAINLDVLKIAYGNNMWVLVGDGDTNNDNILYNNIDPIDSDDWQQASGTPFGTGVANDVLYAGEGATAKWVAVGAHDSTAENIWYSLDGITWTAATDAFGVGGVGNKIYYANGMWVVVGAHSSTAENIYTSVDGVTWSPISGPFGIGGEGKDVLFNNNFWVACGEDGSSAENIWYSTNGTTWTAGTGDPFSVGGRALSIAVKTVTTT